MPDIELKPCPFCGGKAVFDCKRHFSKCTNVGFEFDVNVNLAK